jgi:hypothetical protein
MEDGAMTMEAKVPPEDLEAINDAVRDYAVGWYTADSDRMKRCLHPDLVKRSIFRDSQDDAFRLRRSADASMMVEFTRNGGGSRTPEGAENYEISNLDVFRHIASVSRILG